MEILADPDEEEDVPDFDKAASKKNQSSEKSSQPNSVSDIGESSSSKPAQAVYDSTPSNIPHRLAIKEKAEEESKAEGTSMTKEEKDKLLREKRDARMKALAALNEEQKKRRQERINTLMRKLIDRVSIWTETDKGSDVTESFKKKIQLEIESLKMESFGVEMLHAMGLIYSQKATSFLKSQKFYGLTGIFNRAKDKVNSIKDDLGTFALAHDTFKSFKELGIEREKMLEAQEAKGSEFTLEERVEFEHKAGGTVLGAALRANTYEIRDVLRDVCDKMLYDKNVKLEKRIERATALSMIGGLCQKVCFPFYSEKRKIETEKNDTSLSSIDVKLIIHRQSEAKKSNRNIKLLSNWLEKRLRKSEKQIRAVLATNPITNSLRRRMNMN